MSATKVKLRKLKSSNYVTGGYPRTMTLARPICNELIDELISIVDTANFEQKIEVFKICQRRLNSLMMSGNVDADTVERDIFYNVLEKIGTITGMNSTHENEIRFIEEVLDSDENLDDE